MTPRAQTQPTIVIAVVSAKGGTGKSTVALNLAGALITLKHTVMLVDADSQGSIATWAKTSTRHEPAILIESDPSLIETALSSLRGFEFIVIDTPPTFRKRLRTIIRLADRLILPVSPGQTDFWSTRKLIGIYLREKEKRPSIDARLLISKSDPRTRFGREFRSKLADLSIPIFMAEIQRRKVFNEAWCTGTTVNRLEPKGAAAREMLTLAKEILIWTEKPFTDSQETQSGIER